MLLKLNIMKTRLIALLIGAVLSANAQELLNHMQVLHRQMMREMSWLSGGILQGACSIEWRV